MKNRGNRDAVRHARMAINSAVLLMRAGESWSTDTVDISATGLMVRRPSHWTGELGELYVLDLLIGPELNIHLEARVARVTDWHLGFAYESIPAEKEAALWNLLGSYADHIEPVAS